MKNKTRVGILLALIISLPSCVHVPTYRNKPLQSVRNNFQHCSIEKNVILQAKHLTKDEIELLFGQQGKKLSSFVEAIYLSIHNLSKKDYAFHLSAINMPTSSFCFVTGIMETLSITRLIGAGAAPHTSYGACVVATTGGKSAMCATGVYALLSLSVTFLLGGLVFLATGIKSLVMNDRIDKDLSQKMIPPNTIISSGDHCEGLVFIKRSDYQDNFTLMLYEKNDNQNALTFSQILI